MSLTLINAPMYDQKTKTLDFAVMAKVKREPDKFAGSWSNSEFDQTDIIYKPKKKVWTVGQWKNQERVAYFENPDIFALINQVNESYLKD